MPYGADVSIPNGTSPNQAPQPIPQAQAPDQGHPFDEEALGAAFDKINLNPQNAQSNQPTFDPNDVQKLSQAASNPQGDQRQWSGVNAQGSPSQLAQASIGRNINERLQIWSKLVGDQNAMIGPSIGGQNDIWIRGNDGKFHPADTGHTDFMQDLAKKTGAGIDATVNAVAGLGGGLIAGAPGAVAGFVAGPGISSAGREFIMSRKYGVQTKGPNDIISGQLKRDIAIGGGLNLLTMGLMSGTGQLIGNAAESIAESPAARASKIAQAQLDSKNFMDAVGAKPVSIIDENGNIQSPMSQAGARLYSATQLKRTQLNDLISTANEQITAASNAKVNTSGLASVVKEFMQKDGYKFDDNGMPIPYQDIPIFADQVSPESGEASALIGEVNSSRINRPKMGTDAMNDLAEDYKALASGQMNMDNFLQMTRDWQENAKFKPLDERSDATRSGWAQLQHVATQLRQGEIQTRLANDPEMLDAVNNAYHEYSSSKDAIDMIYNAYKTNQNSPEKLAQLFVRPGKQELLSQANSLFADHPEVMKDVRSAWLSEKMAKYVGSDGIFNANAFMGDLKSTGGETLNQLFKPGELGSIYRASKIMGSVKSNDLISQSQGQNVVDAVGDLASKVSSFNASQPSTWINWLSSKPKLAEYACSPDGFTKLASMKDPATAKSLSLMSSTLKNKLIQSTTSEMIKRGSAKFNSESNDNSAIYQKMNPLGITPPESNAPQGSMGSDVQGARMLQ